MELGKYHLETLLLYLDNQLPRDQAQEISAYLMHHKDILDHLIILSKIKVHTENTAHKLIFDFDWEDHLRELSQGLIFLLEKKELHFRGQGQAIRCRYEFHGFFFSIVYHINQSLELFTESTTVAYQLLNDHLEPILQQNFSHPQSIKLYKKQQYYLLLSPHHKKHLLEIVF